METRSIKAILGLALIVFTTVSANAISHTLVDVDGTAANPVVNIVAGGTYSSSFDLLSPSVTPNFNPAAETITGATATFILTRLSGDNVSMVIDLGGEFFGSANNFFVYGVSDSVNLSLINNNTLDYVITTTGTSPFPTVLVSAVLQFQTGPKTAPVPDGGSAIILFGLAMLGLGWVGRPFGA